MVRVVSILGLAVAVALAGCNQAGQEDKARIAKLEGQVAQLQGKVDRMEAQTHPAAQWILWQRLRAITSRVPPNELPQPRQLGAYDTKDACEKAALMDASEHYQNDSQFGIFDISSLVSPET